MRSKGPFNRQIAIQGNTFRAPIRKAGLASRQNQGPPPSLPRPATTQWGRRTTVSSQPTPEGLALEPVRRLVTSPVVLGRDKGQPQDRTCNHWRLVSEQEASETNRG